MQQPVRPTVGRLIAIACLAACFSLAPAASADTHTSGVPELSSRPGAAYTIYLNFSGFNFAGTWGGGTTDAAPGALVSYNGRAANAAFTSSDLTSIRSIWAQSAEKYATMDVNVTTVDPAIAAGKGDTDVARQAYYDSQARMMHTIITAASSTAGNANYSPVVGGGGVSYVNVTKTAYSTASYNGGAGRGLHTNYAFTSGVGSGANNLSEVIGHENGHGLSLNHQHAYNGTATITAEYSNNGGNAQYAPIMGNSYSAARGVWRTGPVGATTTNGVTTYTIQNDVASLLAQTNMRFVDDGVGHARASATKLVLAGTGGTLVAGANAGYISPVLVAGATATLDKYNPIGESNYTADYFSFATTGGAYNLTVNESGDFVTAGAADGNGTLDSVFRLLDVAGNVLNAATNPNSQTSTISGSLAAGSYFLQVASAGGKLSTGTESASYFDLGSYFLSGSIAGAIVPEPGTLVVAAASLGLVVVRRRRVA